MAVKTKIKRPTPYRFSVDEYERMAEAGIFHEDDPVELIEGEIIQMAAVGNHHIACVNALTMCLTPQVAGIAIASVHNPVRMLPRSEPEPDLVLIRVRPYWNAAPTPEDVLLVIEVADSSLDYDLTTKASLYARQNIPQLWVWDLPNRRVHLLSGPAGGRYREHRIAQPGDVLEVAALPGVRVPVADTLPPEDPATGQSEGR